ncbi:HAMP domain-containing sensor histidine kinase [Catenuloplanes japonicus]|uniref:HAMP domain-containing sensor histidine kinase n=1 Tax=Catenuloplanes japonicus TaxID=33876 RepID=UPI0005263EE4|nr:HAMP domain-containing sensor histidine kinase [Catenuloplanes japonicus]
MRGRLALLVAATTSLTLIAFLLPLALLLRTVAADRATIGATADAQAIVSTVGTSQDMATLRLAVERIALTSGREVTLFLADGQVFGDPVAPTPAVRLSATGRSVTVETADGGREIVIAVQGRSEGTAVIRTFVPAEELTRGVTRSWLLLAALGLVLVLLGLAVADRLARALVRPITQLSEVSLRLAGAELTARAEPAGPPELREVAGALNHLAGRILELLRAEREHVADLSHRLRTPLTALRLEAESLRDRDESARVHAAADGVESAVTAVIRQARLAAADPAESRATGGSADASGVVSARVEFWSVLAEDTGRDVRTEIVPGPLPVALAGDDLEAAVDALLGNVFAHTPDGVAFAVRLARAPDGGAVLTVADEGPGIPAGLVRRGESRGGSTGLGLDIARRAAQTAGGRLELGTAPQGGAIITLHLGPPRPH